MLRSIVLLSLVCALGACSSDPPPPPAPPPTPAKPAPTLLDDQIKAMDKARAVEDLEAERKRKMDAEIDGS